MVVLVIIALKASSLILIHRVAVQVIGNLHSVPTTLHYFVKLKLRANLSYLWGMNVYNLLTSSI